MFKAAVRACAALCVLPAALVALSALAAGCAYEGEPAQNGGITQDTQDTQEVAEIMYITVGSEKLLTDLEDNPSSRALAERLRGGDITVTLNDYGDMEKVGALGFTLPRSDASISVRPGDVILYLGNQLTIYYDANSWNFTRLGHIRGVDSREEMLELLGGKGEITITLSLD